jgi:hypothetical protein
MGFPRYCVVNGILYGFFYYPAARRFCLEARTAKNIWKEEHESLFTCVDRLFHKIVDSQRKQTGFIKLSN